MQKAKDSDFRLFLVILPVLSDMLDEDNFPKNFIISVIHDWTRPHVNESTLSQRDRVKIDAWLQRFVHGKEDKYLTSSQESISSVSTDILSRGSNFNPRRSW
ncbi:hypothetical protein KC963_05360 [Candidatus Saccharibacteria bacterium]|nr:hypothetical protein [Candidatus Saccharibacteria bacterium]